ncbi:MAG: hypothetical protein AAGF96_06120 [Bacteroidota bacterium]
MLKTKQKHIGGLSQDSTLFWVCHPNAFIALWVKHDFFKMDLIDFMYKYIAMIEDPTTDERRREDLKAIIFKMYYEITGRNYDTNYFKAHGFFSAKN